jgi:hypothetical protein
MAIPIHAKKSHNQLIEFGLWLTWVAARPVAALVSRAQRAMRRRHRRIVAARTATVGAAFLGLTPRRIGPPVIVTISGLAILNVAVWLAYR